MNGVLLLDETDKDCSNYSVTRELCAEVTLPGSPAHFPSSLMPQTGFTWILSCSGAMTAEHETLVVTATSFEEYLTNAKTRYDNTLKKK